MPAPLRMLWIVPRFGSISRGVERFAYEVASRLDPKKFRLTILSGPHRCSIPDVEFVTSALIPREKLAWFDALPLLPRAGRHLGYGGAADVEAWSLLRRRFEYLADAFDLVLPFGGHWSYRYAKRAFPKARVLDVGHAGPVAADLRRCDGFVALTPFDKNQALKMRPGLPTWVVPNGVDLARFTPAQTRSRAKSERVILCAAALSSDKRHDLLFDAVSRLPENVVVHCCGHGPAKAALQRHHLAKAGRVRFSCATFDDMPNVYHAADVFSLASPEEAFGIAFVEALACGLPVVAHDGPRQRFVLGDDGIFCNVFDADGYARALAKTLDVIPTATSRTNLNRFDWGHIACQYSDIFLAMAGR